MKDGCRASGSHKQPKPRGISGLRCQMTGPLRKMPGPPNGTRMSISLSPACWHVRTSAALILPFKQRNCADPEGFAPCEAGGGGAASRLPSQFNVRDGLNPQAELCLTPSWRVFAEASEQLSRGCGAGKHAWSCSASWGRDPRGRQVLEMTSL